MQIFTFYFLTKYCNGKKEEKSREEKGCKEKEEVQEVLNAPVCKEKISRGKGDFFVMGGGFPQKVRTAYTSLGVVEF